MRENVKNKWHTEQCDCRQPKKTTKDRVYLVVSTNPRRVLMSNVSGCNE